MTGILLPTIASELDCTVEEAAWVTIGPMFASVVFAPSSCPMTPKFEWVI